MERDDASCIRPPEPYNKKNANFSGLFCTAKKFVEAYRCVIKYTRTFDRRTDGLGGTEKTKEEVSIIFSYGHKANFNTTQRVVLNSRDA